MIGLRKICIHKYNDIISIENLLEAWKEFVTGKTKRKDVQEFERNLMSNIICLCTDLENKTYSHSPYTAFNISDPKPRNIHKASVRDRLLHHAIYRKFYPFFDRLFIYDSYSCRLNRGTHKAIHTFRKFGYIESQNHTKTCWVLKCDIRKCFASVDQKILLEILNKSILDKDIAELLFKIISSFYSTEVGKGLPLGNLTSQLLINIYLNEFDQFMKHKMKVKYYIRYADDFVILSQNRDYLLQLIYSISVFLKQNLKLQLHPDKLFIKTFASGVDFLGWVHFPNHRVLRTATKKKMFRNLASKEGEKRENAKASYLGMLGWGNGYKLEEQIRGKKDLF